GLVVAIASATGAAFVFRWGNLVPPTLAVEQISVVGSFSTPVLLMLVIAIVAGAAGALALSTDLPSAITGVAVAAAIVPAAAATGIGIVWLDPSLALGAFALLLVNVVFINLTTLVALLGFGYRPDEFGGLSETLSLTPTVVISVVVAVVLGIVIVGVLVTNSQYILFDQTVNRNVNDVLTDPTYSELELSSVTVQYGAADLLGQGSRENSITVVVARPAGTTSPRLPAKLQDAIAADTNRKVSVTVRFNEYRRIKQAGTLPVTD